MQSELKPPDTIAGNNSGPSSAKTPFPEDDDSVTEPEPEEEDWLNEEYSSTTPASVPAASSSGCSFSPNPCSLMI